MEQNIKNILRKYLDESLTKLNSFVVYINKRRYKIFRGRIIHIREANGSSITNQSILFQESLNVYM